MKMPSLIYATPTRLIVWGWLTTVLLSNTSWSQTCCNNGGAAVWEGVPAAQPFDPAAELVDPIDPARAIYLTIVVPEKAQVIVNGEPTYTTGIVREYVVRDLDPTKRYKFTIEGIFINEFEALFAAKATLSIPAGSSERVVLHLRRQPRPPKPPVPPVPPVAVVPPAGV